MNLHTLLHDLVLTCPIKWEKVFETPFTYKIASKPYYTSSFNYPNNNDRMIARLSQKAAAIAYANWMLDLWRVIAE